jgi:hypothetical protein
VDGFSHKSEDNRHGFWDTQFVDALGMPPTGAGPAGGTLAGAIAGRLADWDDMMRSD